MSTGSLFQGCKSDSTTDGGTSSAAIDVYPTSGLQTTESAGAQQTASFAVVLKTAPTADVTVPLSSSDTSEGTVSVASLVFTPLNWAAPQIVTVTGVDDEEQDGDVTYSIITAPATSTDLAYAGVNPADVTIKNVDTDSAGIRAVETAGLKTDESGGSAKFKVVLNTKPSGDVTVGIVSGAADEVVAAPATVTFTTANWNAPQEVTLTGVEDDEQDGDVKVVISSSAATSTDLAYAGKKFDDFEITNQDNDTAGFVIEPIVGLMTTESGGTATFTVKLVSQPTADVVLPLSSANPLEVGIDKTSLTFTAENWAALQTVTVTGVNDDVVDGNQIFTIATAPAMSADGRYDGRNPADVVGLNADNDTPGFLVTDVDPGELLVNEDETTDTFYVRLTTRPTGTVSVPVTVNMPAEATASPATLEFTIDNWNAPHPVTVTGVNDDAQDGDQEFVVELGAAVAGEGNSYAGLNPPDAVGVNEDNDAPALRVRATEPIQTSEGGATATFTVGLQTQPASDVIIPIVSSNTGEITVSNATLTFTPSNYGPRTVTLTGVDDQTVDGNPTVTITIGPAQAGADPAYLALPAQTLNATNIDNDSSGVATLFDQQPRYTTEGGGQFGFWIYLRTAPTANVTFPVVTSNVAEATAVTTSVTFTPTDWSAPKQILVQGVDDNPPVNDGDQPYTVNVGPATSTDATYNGLSIPAVAMQNRDNDTPVLRVYQDIQLGETTLVTTEAGGTARFRIALDTQPTANVTIPVTSTNTAEGSLGVVTEIVITPGQWNAVNWVTITGLDDMAPVADGDVTYYITLGNTVSADPLYDNKLIVESPLTVINRDNDTPAVLATLVGVTPLVTTEAGTSSRNIDVVLQTAPQGTVTVPFTSSPAGEVYLNGAPTTSLIFDASNWNVVQQVVVRGIGDATQDGHKAYTVNIGPTTGGDARYNALIATTIAGTNYDVDTPDILVEHGTLVTDENAGQTSFTVVLTSAPTANVTIPVTSLDTDEGIIANGSSLTFTTVNWESPQVVTLEGVDDTFDDGSQAYAIRIGPATSTDPRYAGKSVPNVPVTNSDNDTAEITLAYVATLGRLLIDETAGSASFDVSLVTEPLSNTTLTFTSTNPSKVNLPGPIVFGGSAGPGVSAYNSPETITIPLVVDAIQDGDLEFDIVITATSSNGDYNGMVRTVPVRTDDNDVAGLDLSVATVSVSDNPAGPTTDTFTIDLTSRPTDAVTIPIVSTSLTEGVLTVGGMPIPAGGIVIQPADWNIPVTVTLTGVVDNIVDGPKTYDIEIGPTTSNDPNYVNKTDTVSATTADGDVPAVNWDFVSAGVNDIVSTEASPGAPVTIKFWLNSQPAANVTIPVTLAGTDPDEATLSTALLTFTPSDWNDHDAVGHTLVVTGADDSVDDGNRTYEVEFGPSASGDANYVGHYPGPLTVGTPFLTGINNDDDAFGITSGFVTAGSTNIFEVGTTQEIGIKLQSQPTATVTINVNLGGAPNVATLTSTDDATPGTGTSLVFAPSDWVTTKYITITGQSNGVRSSTNAGLASNAITVVFDPPVSADTDYAGSSIPTLGASVLDVAQDCKGALALWGVTASGRWWIDTDLDPNTAGSFAYCDFTSDGGGWTLLTYSGSTTLYGGVPYPGTDSEFCVYNGGPSCGSGTGVLQSHLAPLLAISNEFGVGQRTLGAAIDPYGELAGYDYAGTYDYTATGGLADVALEYSAGTCTQLKAGVFNNITNTSAPDGTAVFLAQALRTPVGVGGGNYSAISNAYTWGVGSPVAACMIQGTTPVSYLGTWQDTTSDGQYGPQALNAAGSFAVFVR